MITPASALSWQVWSRNRWAVAAVAGYFALLAVLAQLPRALESRERLFEASIPLAFAALFLLASFSFPEGDLATCASGFPRWMLTLPVRTRTLVFWPMLQACAAGAAVWLLPAALLFRPLGVQAAVFWPAAMIAAMTALLQALLWAPSPLPYLRVVATLALTPVFIICGVEGMTAGVPEAVLALAFLALIPAAFAGAVWCLERARRGETVEWRVPAWRADAGRKLAPFLSPDAAQLWFEWRSGGMALPLTVLTVSTLVSLPLLWTRELVPIQDTTIGGFLSLEVNAWLKLLPGILLLLPIFAAVFGCGRRAYDAGSRDASMHPFLAARPLSEPAFIRAKLKAAALSTGLSWAIMLLFAAAWLLLPARDAGTSGPLLVLVGRYCSAKTAGTLLLLLALLVFWTWKTQVQGIWADVSGRRSVALAAPLVAHTSVVLLIMLTAQTYAGAPTMESAFKRVALLLSALIAAGITLKVTTAILALGLARRRLLLKAPQLAGVVAVWFTAVVGVTLALKVLEVSGSGSDRVAQWLLITYAPLCTPLMPRDLHSWPYLAAMAALFVPFSRLLLAPVALGWNRTG